MMKRLAIILLLLAPLRAHADAVAIAIALAEAEFEKAASPAPPATTRPADPKPTPSVAPARPQKKAAGERPIAVVPRDSTVPLNSPPAGGRWVRVLVPGSCSNGRCVYQWQWRPN